MSISHITKTVYDLLQEVTGNAHNAVNLDKRPTYPYITFTLTAEPLTENSEGYYLDIDAFDKSASYQGILFLEDKLKQKLKRLHLETDEALIIFSFNSSDNIRTLDEVLKRRNIRFYLKVWWKKPIGIQRLQTPRA